MIRACLCLANSMSGVLKLRTSLLPPILERKRKSQRNDSLEVLRVARNKRQIRPTAIPAMKGSAQAYCLTYFFKFAIYATGDNTCVAIER